MSRAKMAPTGEERVLECLLCRARWSRADVLAGRYRLETLVCGDCYARMQAAPAAESCFGKAPEIGAPGGKRLPGYEEGSADCARCLDRAVCRRIVLWEEVKDED